jgi:hypothetical protein
MDYPTLREVPLELVRVFSCHEQTLSLLFNNRVYRYDISSQKLLGFSFELPANLITSTAIVNRFYMGTYDSCCVMMVDNDQTIWSMERPSFIKTRNFLFDCNGGIILRVHSASDDPEVVLSIDSNIFGEKNRYTYVLLPLNVSLSDVIKIQIISDFASGGIPNECIIFVATKTAFYVSNLKPYTKEQSEWRRYSIGYSTDQIETCFRVKRTGSHGLTVSYTLKRDSTIIVLMSINTSFDKRIQCVIGSDLLFADGNFSGIAFITKRHGFRKVEFKASDLEFAEVYFDLVSRGSFFCSSGNQVMIVSESHDLEHYLIDRDGHILREKVFTVSNHHLFRNIYSPLLTVPHRCILGKLFWLDRDGLSECEFDLVNNSCEKITSIRKSEYPDKINHFDSFALNCQDHVTWSERTRNGIQLLTISDSIDPVIEKKVELKFIFDTLSFTVDPSWNYACFAVSNPRLRLQIVNLRALAPIRTVHFRSVPCYFFDDFGVFYAIGDRSGVFACSRYGMRVIERAPYTLLGGPQILNYSFNHRTRVLHMTEKRGDSIVMVARPIPRFHEWTEHTHGLFGVEVRVRITVMIIMHLSPQMSLVKSIPMNLLARLFTEICMTTSYDRSE